VGPLQPLTPQRTRAEVLLALLQLLLSERAFQVGIERFLLVQAVVEGNPGFLLVGTGVVLNVDFFLEFLLAVETLEAVVEVE